MKLSLSKIKYAAFASQETNCFEAILCIDGVPSLRVNNDGHGGSDWHHDIVPGATKRVIEYAETLPEEAHPLCKDHLDNTKPLMLKPTIETLVGDLLEDYLVNRQLKAKLKGHTLFVEPSLLGIRQVKGTGAPVTDWVVRNYPKARILNLMPYAEALKIFRQ